VNRHFIVVAGGSGTRMNAALPKQFLLLNGKPVLMHTLNALHTAVPDASIVLVLPQSHFETWEELCSKHSFQLKHEKVAGGTTRFHSVKNGLATLSSGLVAVHDGVRPLVSVATIKRTFEAAEKSGAAVPVIDVNESVRSIDDSGNKALNRALIKLVQTPQCFQYNLMRLAFEQTYSDRFTDCASVIETNGTKITLVEGNEENIKITRPQDLALADWYLANQHLLQ
jgi:2-C-methyl-D-erythritol 4-phosphate cytidylyltransferase